MSPLATRLRRAGATLRPVLDTTARSAITTNANLSFTHTVGAGLTNSIALVVVGNSGSGPGTHYPTGVTWGGVSMTQHSQAASDGLDTHPRTTTLFYLLNPPAGASTVAITLNSGLSVNMVGISMSLQHVDQSNPFGSAVTAVSNSATSQSVNVSSATTTDLDLALITVRNNFPNVGSGMTYVTDFNANAGNTYTEVATKPGTGGTDTLNYTWSTSETNALLGVPLHGAA